MSALYPATTEAPTAPPLRPRRGRPDAAYRAYMDARNAEIVARYEAGGVTQEKLAEEYGLSGQTAVAHILRRCRAEAAA